MVHQLCHKDFLDCKALSETLIKNRNKNENGETVNWMKIKVQRFQKNSQSIQYKYRYGEYFSSLNIFGRGRPAALVTFWSLSVATSHDFRYHLPRRQTCRPCARLRSFLGNINTFSGACHRQKRRLKPQCSCNGEKTKKTVRLRGIIY